MSGLALRTGLGAARARLVGYLALAATMSAAGWIVASAFFATAITVTLAVVVAAMAWRREFLLDPLGPVLFVVLTSAVIPALLGHLDSTPMLGIDHGEYVRASFALFVFVAVAVVVYVLPQRGPRRPLRLAWANPERLSSPAAWLAWACLFVVALAALAYVVRQAGTFSGHLDSLANRRETFAGRTWVTMALLAPSIASLLLVVTTSAQPTRRWLPVAAAVTASCVPLLVTGSRTQLLIYLASLAVVVHRRAYRLRPTVLAAGVTALVLAGAVAVNVRQAGTAEGVDLSATTEIYSRIDTSGPISDFGHMPALALITSPENPVEHQWGRTYLSAATIWLPRSIAPWKLPVGGEVATSEILPERWYTGTAMHTTAPGEAYLNFGWPGIPLAAVVFGLLLRGLRSLSVRKGTLAVLAYAVALPHVALLLRGDLGLDAHTLGMQTVVLLTMLAVGARVRPSHVPATA